MKPTAAATDDSFPATFSCQPGDSPDVRQKGKVPLSVDSKTILGNSHLKGIMQAHQLKPPEKNAKSLGTEPQVSVYATVTGQEIRPTDIHCPELRTGAHGGPQRCRDAITRGGSNLFLNMHGDQKSNAHSFVNL